MPYWGGYRGGRTSSGVNSSCSGLPKHLGVGCRLGVLEQLRAGDRRPHRRGAARAQAHARGIHDLAAWRAQLIGPLKWLHAGIEQHPLRVLDLPGDLSRQAVDQVAVELA